MMISKETALRIWNCYREIDEGAKLIADIEETLRNGSDATPIDHARFDRDFELGVPMRHDGHRILGVHPRLAVSIVKAHIAQKHAQAAEANEQARIELMEVGEKTQNPSAPPTPIESRGSIDPDKLDAKFRGEIIKSKDGTRVPDDQWIVFLAKDNAVPAMLGAYFRESRRLGALQAQLDSVSALITRVWKWREENSHLCKVADVEEGELLV